MWVSVRKRGKESTCKSTAWSEKVRLLQEPLITLQLKIPSKAPYKSAGCNAKQTKKVQFNVVKTNTLEMVKHVYHFPSVYDDDFSG